MHPPSFQTSPGKDLNNGSSNPWVCHNTSNTGSSRLLQQHAREASVALPPDATSSRAISLSTSSTQRQGCIKSVRCVEPGVGGGEENENSRLYNASVSGVGRSNRDASPQAEAGALEANKRRFATIGRGGQLTYLRY